MTGLSEDKRAVVDELVTALAEITGVAAVVLGGSCARGAARPDSDVDLGVYYREEAPFSIEAVRAVARRFHLAGEPTVTAFYEWGPWVNGGAWLDTRCGRVDLLYRELGHVERTIDAARRGSVEWHFGQQPPYGFRSTIYLAETQVCVPLYDPDGVLAPLKARLSPYSEALRSAIVRTSLWSAEFTLWNARKVAAAGDVYATVGSFTRIACELTQALFALNRQYCIGDKGALDAVDAMALRPAEYGDRMIAILVRPGEGAAALGASMDRIAELVHESIGLAVDIYEPRYRL